MTQNAEGSGPKSTRRFLRDRVIARIREMDRDLQLRATGATIHLVNNLRSWLQLLEHEALQPGGAGEIALVEFPPLVREFAHFLEVVAKAVEDQKITEPEVDEIEELWVQVMSACGLYLLAIRRAVSVKPKGGAGA